MALRLQEIHPSLVHYPIALVPTAVIADAIGYCTGNRTLMEMGRLLMPVAAASALITGAAGALAQGAVRANGPAHDLLATHRTLNIVAATMATVMAAQRSRRREPSIGYLVAGLATVATMAYTAYLGGKMVYEHGVGVKRAGGLVEEGAPELRMGQLGTFARAAARDMSRAFRHSASDIAAGAFVPALTR